MKKILSVVLSLLLVFSTISVVFTLPATAKTVKYTVFSENFDGYEQGSSVGSTQTIPTENGWVKTGANYQDTVINPATDIDGFSFNAVSGTQVGAFKTWAKPGIVLNVTPGVTYSLTSKVLSNDVGSSVVKAIYVFDVTGKEGLTLTENWSRKTTVIGGTSVDCFAYADLNSSRGLWLDGNISFTPAEGVTKVFIAFYSEANGASYTEFQKSLFIDDVEVSYSVEVGVPVVTTTTTGADNKNGGVAWVEEDGDNFVFKAVPYETATFTGWYRNDQLVSADATITESASTATNIEARFNAIYKNVFPEGSFEDEAALGATDAPSAANALFWGNGRPSNDIKEIGANDWVGQSWAGIVVANNAFLNTKIAGLTAYAGTKAAYISRNNNHTNYKVVRGLKTNTDYYLTYYVYQDTASSFNANDSANNGTVSYCTTGIPTGATSVHVADMNLKVAGTTGQTRIPYEYISDARTSSNAWTKHAMKFNTGNHTDVLINFCANGGNVFVDHVSLYYKPSPEITVTTVGEGTNGGIAWTNKPEALPGEELTYSAKAYANAKFLGWYKNGDLHTTEESFTQAYNADDIIEARFDAFATNLDTKASAEEYALGEIMEGSAHRSPWGEVETNAYVKLNSDYPEIAKMYYARLNSTNAKAYSGTKALENLTGAHGFFKIYDVEPNSTYHFSYWYYQDSARMEIEGGWNSFPDAAIIPSDATNIYIKGGSNVSNTLIAKEGQTMTDLFIDTPIVYYKTLNVVGEWAEVKYTFLTGESDTKVVIPMPTASGVYFDHFTLYKEPEFESAYSFAVVPDTQKFNDDDIIGVDNDYDINAAFSKLYDDILAKKDSKNIQMVIGLGDITENSFTSEYARAKEQFDRLDAANLPYTALPGNHDYLNQFKQQIPYEQYKSTAVGSYNGLANTYHKFTANGIKYLVLTLQYGAPDDVLAWASDIVTANADYNVIVTTHGYLKANGQRLGEKDGHSPGNKGEADENGNYEPSGLNHSTDIWNKFVSKHENIIMVLSGHIEYDGVRITESYGENGNKVLEMLIDGQGLDERARNENLQEDVSLPDVAYALVAYFNFSADGKKLNIEYYSTNLEKLFYEITVDLPVVETEVETLTVVSGNNGNVSVNGKLGNNVEYKAVAGTEVTLFADAYEGVEFLGWFDGETELSTETTYTTTIATKTITAKFEEKNIVADSSFEDLKVGDSPANWTMGASTGTWAKAIAVDSVNNPRTALAALPYSGNRMLAISHRNNAGLYYEIDVDKYAEYKLSLKWLLTLAYGDLSYNEEFVASNIKYVAVGTAEQEYYQEGKMLAVANPGNSDGLWSNVTLDFESGKNEKVRIFIEFQVGNADQYDAAYGTSTLYIDDLAVVKTAQGEEPVCEHVYDNECDAECNLCGEVRVAPHAYGEWTEVTPGTCTTPSTEQRVCAHDASHVETREGSINSENHAWGEWIETRTPNCSDAGEKQRVCLHDATHVETEEIGIVEDAHNYGAWTVTRTPTCSDAGEKQRVCIHNANHVETAEVGIDENAHTYDDEYDADCNDCGDIREVPERPTFTLGDIDGKNGINNSDLIMLRRYLAGWDVEINEDAANLDGKGGVNNSDAIWLARHLAGWDGYELN